MKRANISRLPRDLQQLRYQARNAKLPRNSETTTQNEWLQLQPRIWKATGGLTRYPGQQRANSYWIKLWDRNGNEVMSYSDEHRFKPNYVVLNRAGTIGASSDELGDIHVWDAQSGKQMMLIQSRKSEIYKVEWDQTGTKLHFSTKFHPQGKYKFNDRGVINKTFDLYSRHVADANSPQVYRPNIAGSARIVGDNLLIRQGASSYQYLGNLDQITRTEDALDGIMGMPYSAVTLQPNAANRLSAPAIVGSEKGEVQVIDSNGRGQSSQRRKFIGHAPSLITSIALSPSNDLFATSSTDGTIRIWSLRGITDAGVFDFGVRGTQVLKVLGSDDWQDEYNSEGWKAGIRDTDEILSVNGIPYYEYQESSISNKPRPGDYATVVVRRRATDTRPVGPERTLQVKMIRGAEKVRPLLSLFISKEGDWIMWTPDGYYDASPGGDKYIGFHINQGDDQAALWFTAAQFEQQLYRPDIIDLVLNKRAAIQPSDFPAEDAPIAPQEDLETYRPPKLLVNFPADGYQSRKRETQLRATITSGSDLPIREVRLTVNGRPVKVDSDVDGIRSTEFVQPIRLDPGRNMIEMYVANRRVKSDRVLLAVDCVDGQPTLAPPPPKLQHSSTDQSLHVLSVGISDYEMDGLDLQYAHQDARDFIDAWKNQQGFYKDIAVEELTNENATRTNVLKAIRQLRDKVQKGDRAVLFFSAHGAVDEDGNYYLLPHEADPDGLLETAILYTTIQKTIELLLTRDAEVLMFVDTCHSGGSTGAKSVSNKSIRLRQSKKDAWRHMQDTSCVVFTSSQPGQESYEEPQWENGAFTEALLEALYFSDRAMQRILDGDLSVDELQTYLGERVPELTSDRQSPGVMRNSNTPSFTIAVENP